MSASDQAARPGQRVPRGKYISPGPPPYDKSTSAASPDGARGEPTSAIEVLLRQKASLDEAIASLQGEHGGDGNDRDAEGQPMDGSESPDQAAGCGQEASSNGTRIGADTAAPPTADRPTSPESDQREELAAIRET